ncbi:hypothetical protein PG984_013867 [Apiospora sp. TS-2023a]
MSKLTSKVQLGVSTIDLIFDPVLTELATGQAETLKTLKEAPNIEGMLQLTRLVVGIGREISELGQGSMLGVNTLDGIDDARLDHDEGVAQGVGLLQFDGEERAIHGFEQDDPAVATVIGGNVLLVEVVQGLGGIVDSLDVLAQGGLEEPAEVLGSTVLGRTVDNARDR